MKKEKMHINLKLNIDHSLLIDNVYCKYYITDKSKPIVIVFGLVDSAVSDQEVKNNISPWGFDFIKSQKLNVISFVCYESENWYSSEIFYEFCKNLSKELSQFPERLGYGGSMGGYGVSAYSNILNIDRILIISPVSTVNKHLAPFIGDSLNWINGESPDLGIGNGKIFDGANTTSKGYVIYDPSDRIDTKHAHRYTTLVQLRIPGLGHSMIPRLNKHGILKWIFSNFVANSLDKKYFYKITRKRRYILEYYNRMLRKNNDHLTEKRKKIIQIYKWRNIKQLPLLDELEFLIYKANYDEAISLVKDKNLPNPGINLLRDTAIALESDNVLYAYKLMKAAFAHRKGPLIKRKLDIYQETLSE